MAKAAVAITRGGARKLAQLLPHFPDMDGYVSEAHGLPQLLREELLDVQVEPSRLHVFSFLREEMPRLFLRYDGLVFFFAAGIAVRMLAPLLNDKKRDPGVVVVDEGGKFAISLLSGHLGGANQLTRQVAVALGAEPVITTASDRLPGLPLDLLGERYGWHLAYGQNVTRVMAALVNGEAVGIVQESGQRDWHEAVTGREPEQVRFYSTVEEALADDGGASAWVLITHRRPFPLWQELLNNSILYHPRSLVLGVGCSRGVTVDEVEEAVEQVLERHGLSPLSIRNMASIALKKDEVGLLEAAERQNWPIFFYSAEELNRISIPNPSDIVYRVTGAYGVSEPAAMLSAETDHLLVQKVKTERVTLSIGMVSQRGTQQGKELAE